MWDAVDANLEAGSEAIGLERVLCSKLSCAFANLKLDVVD